MLMNEAFRKTHSFYGEEQLIITVGSIKITEQHLVVICLAHGYKILMHSYFIQAKADLHFQQLKVKFLLKSSVLPQNRVGLGLLLSRRNLIFNLTAFWPNLTFNYYESSFYYSIGGI